MNQHNGYEELSARVTEARSSGQPLVIRGAGSKQFYGRPISGTEIDMRPYAGIITYEPTELFITARAGTPLREIETCLAGHGQMLAFEPPHFREGATLGGVVATGLSGPRRPYTGSVRDYVLGVKCLTGKGEILSFGGQVMKNVAGYDVSRLMTGALGTLGILLEVTLKVWPKPEHEITLSSAMDFDTAINAMNSWAAKPLSLSAACYDGRLLHVRLSGKPTAVDAARKGLPLDQSDAGLDYWYRLREQQLEFFNEDKPLWRLSVPSASGKINLGGDWLVDWGGGQRWFKTDAAPDQIRHCARQSGGHATLFRGGGHKDDIFHPIPPALMQVHQRLKHAFDPEHILNRGRMYQSL